MKKIIVNILSALMILAGVFIVSVAVNNFIFAFGAALLIGGLDLRYKIGTVQRKKKS